jgi:asparagine synthase (glutamine-hydrolysing)
MCGIAGFCGNGCLDDLQKMMSVLKKRGPDMEGVFVSGLLFMGHCRLSVIDLSERSRQPMANEDGTIWVICNGEIYNFKELKSDLLKRGHRFKSGSDTEVILHLYEDKGLEAIPQFIGMYAFVIWDAKKKRLILGRDKMGQKPLFYAQQGGNFFFASEARAIVKHSVFSVKLNLKAMAKYFLHEHVPTPEAIWEDMHKLPPATLLIYNSESGNIELKEYWRLTFSPKIILTWNEYIEELDKRIAAAVKRHSIADVPQGIFMSGGLDSTTIAYYAQRFSNKPIKTFTVGFPEKGFNEFSEARVVADYLGTDHREIVISDDDMFNLADRTIKQLDEPFADSSLIPYYYLSKISRKDVTIALGGDGGDELFVGYLQLKAHDILSWYRFLPYYIRRYLIRPLVLSLPSTFGNLSWEYKAKKFIQADGFLSNPFHCQKIWMGAFVPKYLSQLFSDTAIFNRIRPFLFEDTDALLSKLPKETTIEDRLLYLTQHQYLMDDGLTRTDRASMMNSLEVRSPYLDDELVDWVNKIPYRVKFHQRELKHLFKKLVRKLLPKELLTFPKRGFTPSLSRWFFSKQNKKIEEVLFSNNEKMFRQSFLIKIWNEHINRRFDHRKTLWTFFVWKIWSKEYLGHMLS